MAERETPVGAAVITRTTARVAFGVVLVLWLAAMTALLQLVEGSAPDEVTRSGGTAVLVVLCILGVVVTAALVVVNGAARGARTPRPTLARASVVAAAVAALLVVGVAVVVVRDLLGGGEAAGTTVTLGVFTLVPLLGAVALAERTRRAVTRSAVGLPAAPDEAR